MTQNEAITNENGATAPLLLSAENVAKSFAGVPALVDGRIRLRAGTVNALCGGNGAGKSTFLGVLMGMLRRDAGSVTVKGREVNFSSPPRRSMPVSPSSPRSSARSWT